MLRNPRPLRAGRRDPPRAMGVAKVWGKFSIHIESLSPRTINSQLTADASSTTTAVCVGPWCHRRPPP